MKLSTILLLVPAAALVFAATLGPVACSSAGSTTPPADELPPGVTFPAGYVLGGACVGYVYVVATSGEGYLVCYDGQWTYDDSIPSGGELGPSAFADDSGDDSGVDDGTGDDASEGGGSSDDASEDGGSSDDASEDGGSGDDSARGDDAAEDGGSGDDSSAGDAGDDSGG